MMVLSSTHPPNRCPEIMFRGPPECRPRDMKSVPSNVSVRFSSKATYSSTTIMGFLENKFKQPGILEALSETTRYRVLVLDQFSAHVKPEVVEAIIKKYHRVPLLCFGGLTGHVQVADVFQNKILKAAYRVEESRSLARYLRRRPNEIPRMSREDILWATSRAR